MMDGRKGTDTISAKPCDAIKRAWGVSGGGEGHDAVPGNVAALCGTQAGHTIQAGGYAAGTAGVCAVYIAHQTSRDGRATVLQNGAGSTANSGYVMVHCQDV